MELNKHIVVATLGLATIGIIKHYTQPNVPLTRIFIGSFVFMLALSVADLAGGQVSKFASALAMLALVNGILTEIPPGILTTISSASGGKSSTNTTTTTKPSGVTP